MSDKAWYSGAPIQHDFGDLQPKGVLVVTVEKGEEPQVELVELEGIKPLITVTEVPEKWPTECYIRYLGPMEGIIDLPENVIKTQGVISVEEDETEPQKVQVEFGDSVTEGLSEYLAGKGIAPELQEEAVKWVQEKYVK
jgi:DNA repair exonuclease SbcCD nuclease subunit